MSCPTSCRLLDILVFTTDSELEGQSVYSWRIFTSHWAFSGISLKYTEILAMAISMKKSNKYLSRVYIDAHFAQQHFAQSARFLFRDFHLTDISNLKMTLPIAHTCPFFNHQKQIVQNVHSAKIKLFSGTILNRADSSSPPAYPSLEAAATIGQILEHAARVAIPAWTAGLGCTQKSTVCGWQTAEANKQRALPNTLRL